MGNSFMKKTSNSENLLHMLQKPAEIFAGIMPMDRRIYSSRLYMRRCGKKDSQTLHKLMTANRDYLEKWLQPQPKVISIDCVRDIIEEDKRFAKLGQRLDLAIFDSATMSLLSSYVGHIGFHRPETCFYIFNPQSNEQVIRIDGVTGSASAKSISNLLGVTPEGVLIQRIEKTLYLRPFVGEAAESVRRRTWQKAYSSL